MSGKTKKQPNPYYKELIKRSEIKRISENLNKRELTNVLGVHYNFYWNCVNNKNEVSPHLAEALEKYLKTPTHKIYETVFAIRPRTETSAKVKRDETGKEMYNVNLGIEKEFENKVVEDLTKEGVLKFPEEADL